MEIFFLYHEVNLFLIRFWVKNTLVARIWTQILYFFKGNRESYCHLYLAHQVTWNMDSNYVPIKGRKNGCLTFCSKFGLEIFSLYREITHLKIKFWVKNMLLVSYSWALIALKVCWKVTSNNRFGNNFWTVRNSLTRHDCFWKNTFEAWIWTKNLYFFYEIKGVSVVCIRPGELP